MKKEQKDLFNDMKKGMKNGLEWDIKNNKDTIKEHKMDIEQYERELERLPKWIMDKKTRIKALISQNECTEANMALIADMELNENNSKN